MIYKNNPGSLGSGFHVCLETRCLIQKFRMSRNAIYHSRFSTDTKTSMNDPM
jgi:hypothetical protein